MFITCGLTHASASDEKVFVGMSKDGDEPLYDGEEDERYYSTR